MDANALLVISPLDALDDSVKDFLREALAEEGSVNSRDDLVELLTPFLVDAGLVANEADVVALCQTFPNQAIGDLSTSAQPSGATSSNTIPNRALGQLCAVSDEGLAFAWQAASGVESRPSPHVNEIDSTAKVSRSSARAEAAKSAAIAEAALLNCNAMFRLRDPTATRVAEEITALLTSDWPALAGDSIIVGVQPDYVAASFISSAEELGKARLLQWCACLADVLEEVGVQPEEQEEHSKALDKLVRVLVRKNLLEVLESLPEAHDLVQVLLPEDEQWHPAVITEVLEDRTVQITFVEYGKPLTVGFADIRPLEVGDDEDGADLKDGQCQMCERHMPLTFHHLIPKDTHPTYLKKRLPRGIEGEPSRAFLNGYGLMICRKCHNMVHLLASNSTLATEYNTLEKLMAQSTISSWVGYAKKQHV